MTPGERIIEAEDHVGFTPLPTWLQFCPEATSTDLRVWQALAYLVWYYRNVGSPTVDDIAKVSFISVRQTIRCLNHLEAIGAIKRTAVVEPGNGQTRNIYELVRDSRDRGDISVTPPPDRGDISVTPMAVTPVSPPTTSVYVDELASSESPEPDEELDALIEEVVTEKLALRPNIRDRANYAAKLRKEPDVIAEAERRRPVVVDPATCRHPGYEPGEECRHCEAVLV